MTTQELLTEVKQITEANMEFVRSRVVPLSKQQLEWRPSASSWSITEVLAHLNAFSSFYIPTFERKIANTRFRSSKEEFVSSPLGRSAWKSMKLGNARNIKRKFKSVRSNNPTFEKSLVNGVEIHTFISNQESMLTIINDASNVNLRKVKIPISISKIIRLRLGDALLYVTYHSERHIQQMASILNHKHFPTLQ